MRKAWQIFSRDLMRLLRNPVAVAVTIVVEPVSVTLGATALAFSLT